MSPFNLIFILLGVIVGYNFSAGHIIPMILAIVSALLFFKEWWVYQPIKDAEPRFKPGITDKIFFLRFRPWMVLAEIVGLVALFWTIIARFI
jgi:hypothetical protein